MPSDTARSPGSAGPTGKVWIEFVRNPNTWLTIATVALAGYITWQSSSITGLADAISNMNSRVDAIFPLITEQANNSAQVARDVGAIAGELRSAVDKITTLADVIPRFERAVATLELQGDSIKNLDQAVRGLTRDFDVQRGQLDRIQSDIGKLLTAKDWPDLNKLVAEAAYPFLFAPLTSDVKGADLIVTGGKEHGPLGGFAFLRPPAYDALEEMVVTKKPGSLDSLRLVMTGAGNYVAADTPDALRAALTVLKGTGAFRLEQIKDQSPVQVPNSPG